MIDSTKIAIFIFFLFNVIHVPAQTYSPQRFNSVGFEVEIKDYRLWQTIKHQSDTNRSILYNPTHLDEATLLEYEETIPYFPEFKLFKLLTDNCGDAKGLSHGSCAPEFVTAPLPLDKANWGDSSSDNYRYWKTIIAGIAGTMYALEAAMDVTEDINITEMYIKEQSRDALQIVSSTDRILDYQNAFEEMRTLNPVFRNIRDYMVASNFDATIDTHSGSEELWNLLYSRIRTLRNSLDHDDIKWTLNKKRDNSWGFQATIGIPFVYVSTEKIGEIQSGNKYLMNRASYSDFWKSANLAGDICFKCVCGGRIKDLSGDIIDIENRDPVSSNLIEYYQLRNLFNYMQAMMILYSNEKSDVKFNVGDLFYKVNPPDLMHEILLQFATAYQYDENQNVNDIKTAMYNRMNTSHHGCLNSCVYYTGINHAFNSDDYPAYKKARNGGWNNPIIFKKYPAQKRRLKIMQWFFNNRRPASEKSLENFLSVGLGGYELKPYRVENDPNRLLYIVSELRLWKNMVAKEFEIKLLVPLGITPQDTIYYPDITDDTINQALDNLLDVLDQSLAPLYDVTSDHESFLSDMRLIS